MVARLVAKMADHGGQSAALGVTPAVVEPGGAVCEAGDCGVTVEAEQTANRALLARLGEHGRAQLPGRAEEVAGQRSRAQRPYPRARAEALIEQDGLECVGGEAVGDVLARIDE